MVAASLHSRGKLRPRMGQGLAQGPVATWQVQTLRPGSAPNLGLTRAQDKHSHARARAHQQPSFRRALRVARTHPPDVDSHAQGMGDAYASLAVPTQVYAHIPGTHMKPDVLTPLPAVRHIHPGLHSFTHSFIKHIECLLCTTQCSRPLLWRYRSRQDRESPFSWGCHSNLAETDTQTGIYPLLRMRHRGQAPALAGAGHTYYVSSVSRA